MLNGRLVKLFWCKCI